MKKLIFIYFFTILIFGCAYNKNAMSINTGKYDAAYLKASYLANEGKVDDALVILNFINKEVKDEHIVLKIADLHIVKKEYDVALSVINDAIKTDELKNKDILYYQKAKLLYALGKKEESIKTIQKAIKIADEEDYLKFLATLQIEKKDYASAINTYNKLIQKKNLSSYYYQRGKLYLSLKLDENAIDDFKKAIEIDGSILALLTLSDYYLQKKDYKQAIFYLEQINDDMTNTSILAKYKLGQLYIQEKEDEKAINVFKEIVGKINNKDQKFFILKRLGTLYFEKRDYKSSQKYFIQAAQNNPNDIQTIYFIGVTSEAIKKYDVAKKYYKKALELSPDYGEALKRLAYLEMKGKNYKKSLEYINKVVEIDKDVDFFRLKALIFSAQKDYKNQKLVIEEGLKHYKNNEDLLMDYAFYLESQKQYDEAIKLLKKTIKIYPDNASALNFLGYLYADLNKNVEEAYKLVKRALEIQPDNYAYMDSMAWVLYRQGKYEEAYKYQKEALKKSPNEKEVIEHMKAILKALGSKKTIKDVLQEK